MLRGEGFPASFFFVEDAAMISTPVVACRSAVRARSRARPFAAAFAAFVFVACSDAATRDDSGIADGGPIDAGGWDASGSDAGLNDGSAGDAAIDAGVASLAERMNGVMAPAFAATPASLDQCVGGVAVVLTPTESHIGSWGATTLGGTTTPDATTLFQIGSLTKVFTGVGMARQVEAGAFSLDTPADVLLGADLAEARTTWPTMGALITHHAGLPAFPANLVDRNGDGRRDPGIDPRSPAAGYSRVDLRNALTAWMPPAGDTYLYSNVGIGMAGLALQDSLGLTRHHDTLRRLIADDLGMGDTFGEVAAIPDSARARLATGHVVEGMRRVAGIPGQMGVLASAGEVVTTAEDMERWLRALTGLEVTPLAAAVARASTRLAEGPEGRGMGYAIEIEDVGGVTRYRKGGNTSSYGAYLLWSTSPAVGVAVMTNCGGFRRVVTLAEELYDTAAPR
jgi:CubicO group peptidase (beta-lactamase class C family)